MKNKNFLIRDGFRERIIRLWAIPSIRFGLSLLMFAVAIYCKHLFGSETGLGVGLLATVPLISFKKEGLDGDNLKLVDDLEKRMSLVPEELRKQILDGMLNTEFEKRMKKFEGLDPEKIIAMLGDDEKGLRSILLKQGEEITRLKGNAYTKPEDLSLRSQISAWVEKNKDAFEKLKAGERASLTPLQVRAATSPMTPATTLASTITMNAVIPQFESGIHDVRRLQPTFWDYLPKGRSSSAAYSWVNKKVGAEGAAAFIGPGIAKPGVSFTLEREVSNAKKIAVSSKTVTELLMDVEGFESYIRDEMTYQLKQKANTTLMNGVLSSTVPAGIQTFSVPYSLAGVSTTNPNNFDAIRAAVAQLAIGFFGGLPVTVFVNPVDAANMDLSKAISNGTYLLPPFSTTDGRRVAGAVVIEDNNIPAGFFQAACLDLFKNLIYQDFTISVGWENDDFTKNLVTLVAELRLHSFHSGNDAGGFIYDTFANVQAAIAAA